MVETEKYGTGRTGNATESWDVNTMRRHHESITDTFLFRLAQAMLPEQALLALFGRRLPVAADRCDVRRMVARRRLRR
jgi:hypothetical protein